MQDSRRSFLYKMTLLSIACTKNPMTSYASKNDSVDWTSIKSDYMIDDYPIMNLNSGSAGIMSRLTFNNHIEYLRLINSHAPYEILSQWEKQIKSNLHRLSDLIHATRGHLYLLRNSTEAINIVLWGIKWKKRNEIIYATCDYPLLTNSLQSLKKKKSVKLVSVNHGRLKEISDDEIVKNYERKISKKTRLLVVTYITHREGHILPVKKICEMAHSHGVEVLVDAAHAIGHIDHSIESINCDYYTSSPHKWLNAPLGTGVLYVNDDCLTQLNPPLSYPLNHSDKVDKFEFLGTRAFQNGMTLGHAIDDLENVGLVNKQERLHMLKKYWTEKIKDLSEIEIITDINRSCAVASIKIPQQHKVQQALLKKYKIHVKKSGYKGEGFLRISPNIFTLESDLDHFVTALVDLTK